MINRSSRSIATLFGIPLHLHWSALLTAAFIGMSAPAAVGIGDTNLGSAFLVGTLAAIFFAVSLLVHEYAHALVARHHGIGVRRVSLWALGGMAELEFEPRRWSHEFGVSIAGPLASIGIGVVSVMAALGFGAAGFEVPTRLFAWLAVVNLVLGVFNLLPGYPLDGGRVVHSLVWWRTGSRTRASLATATSGRIIGALLIGFGIWSLVNGGSGLLTAFIGWFIMSSATQARAVALRAKNLTGRRAADVARPVPPAVNADLTVAAFLAYWVPAMSPVPELVLLVDGDQRAVGLVATSSAWAVPHEHRDRMPLSALAIGAEALSVVAPGTDLADAVVTSPSGFILVSEPDRLVGIITPGDLAEPDATPATPAGAGAGL